MDQKKNTVNKQDETSGNNVSRAQSQDALDSSSASSLSFFADHSDAQANYPNENEKPTEGQKSEESSPRPPMDEALKSEKAFIEFVMSLPPKERSEHHHRSTDSVMSKTKAPSSTSNSTKVGLDHLDNLCKLMEQLSELRDTNNKLQRRVQYLEDLKTLHDMHKEISEEGQYSSEDALAAKPRPYELQKSATETCCPKKENTHIVHSARTHSKYLSRRGRAQSADGQRRERSKSVGHEDAGEDTKSKRIFPKWSKVKEAFGWESDRKDSVKMRSEVETETLRCPRRCSDESEIRSHQPYHRSNSPTWSQDFPSLHSSLEDVNEILDSERWKRVSVASEKNVYLDPPKECLRRLKSTPSPGSEKLIPSKEISDLKPKSSTIERDSYSHQDYSKFDRDDAKRGKSPWGRVKTIIERRRDSLKRRSLRRDHGCLDCDSVHLKKTPEVAEIKSYADYVESSLRQPVITDSHKHKHHHVPDPIIIDEEVDYRGPRTPSSSPTFHRKSRWTRVKKALTGKKEDDHDPPSSTPASPNAAQDGHFTFDAIEEITQDTYDEGREIKRVGSDSHVHQLSLSAPACDLMLQLQRNLSDDFHRKIMEWERIRASGHVSCSPQWDRKPSMTTRSRKKSERDDKNIKPKLKDLTWLEKELQKIEKEKQRLSKERQKYEERALRLEKLKETVLNAKNSNKREVFVRTSAGEFRFEGISDAFTKKLYEWETKRGLGPELSTIALLDSSRLTVQTSIGPKSGPLQRVVSRSESSIADIGGQHSHNSSNSLPSLKIPDTIDADRTNQPSRANSEPDLSTLVALTNGNNVSVNALARQVDDSLEDVIDHPEINRESEEDELEKKRNDSETYYGLLEENVILLEQLKDKEEICSRLQKELEVLDKKVDVMNKHHTQETERYREKLWEMHKPGATPRDVQGCLKTMSQLQKRIDTLEKCTEKLRMDRESVEDSFRYHSKQQEDMTLDLLQKMSELQAAGSSTADCETPDYIPSRMNASVVERLQDLSALLVKQTQDLQGTLSAKTRQICQLRWELLHRDLSTVKLETELHTHNAHRKRSKYAHYRSHSSEEAPAVPLPQELECGKSTLITEAYYNITPETDFQAKELTNTVQQLNKEVLKLASVAESLQDHNQSESSRVKSSNERPWVKSSMQSRGTDKSKQIIVRRSSADNLNAALLKGERWKNNDPCSSDDGYTKISLHPATRNNCLPNAERLLMSSGEHPPRGYLHRRKKFQKPSKDGYSPNRRRSKTFHNKRDFEKPFVLDNTPQKYHSFRLPTERNINYSDSGKLSDTVNIRNLLGEVKYREFLKRRAQICRGNIGQTQFSVKNTSKMEQDDDKVNNIWLREVASDSKIPLLFQLQCRNDELLRNNRSNKCPVRSFSDKHAKETAAERREIFQKRRGVRHLTSPDLFSNLNENLKARILAKTHSQSKILKEDETNYNFNKNVNTQHQRQCSEKSSNASNIPKNNTDATVTIQLPKKKSRKLKPKVTQDNIENTEQTVTIVIPKKRSISSEKEFDTFYKNTCNLKSDEKSKEKQSCSKHESKTADSPVDLKLYSEENISNDAEMSKNTIIKIPQLIICNASDNVKERQQNEKTSRKRKAEDGVSASRGLTEKEKDAIADHYLNASNQNCPSPSLSSDKENIPTHYGSNYIKSPSAPQLDWRKGCSKKISKESASNVRSLIEKYNKVAENQQFASPNSSNLSSPTWNRKISAPLQSSKSDRGVIASQSASTPTTPSIISASAFYNPLVFKPINLDLFPRSAPESPLSAARAEAIRRAKEQFISSQNVDRIESPSSYTIPNSPLRNVNVENTNFVNKVTRSLSAQTNTDTKDDKKTDDDRLSNCSMDSTSLVMFRTGETCQESRLHKRSIEYSRTEADTLERRNNLKTSKSLSNSSLFKSVLSSDFKMPSTLLKLRRSKKKKDMATVSHLCRQSLLLTTEDTGKVLSQSPHKSCPSSPELKTKSEIKSNWFHRNILRHK